MNAYFEMLERRVESAAQWRKENQSMADRGWVLFYRGDVCGWADELSRPRSWCPGCVAVGVHGIDGVIYRAIGGNDDAGAEEWSPIWNPVTAASAVRDLSAGGFRRPARPIGASLQVKLSESEKGMALRFFGAMRYGDVYKDHFVSHWGDGNKAGSESDVETREILRVVEKVYWALRCNGV